MIKLWNDFPRIFLTNWINDNQVQTIEWEGTTIRIGDSVIWKFDPKSNDSFIIKIDAIRLNPTLRFWSQKQGGWFLACNCSLIK